MTRRTRNYVTAWCGQDPKRHDRCTGLDGRCRCACHAINAAHVRQAAS